MVKKKKTKVKAKRHTVKRSPKRVAAAKPLSKAHERTLKVVSAALDKAEKLGAKVVAAEETLEVAIGNIEKAVHAASRKKTVAARRATVTAKNAAKKARVALMASKAKAHEAEKSLKESVKLAEVERKLEEAKEKAVAAFLSKWQKTYDRKIAKKSKGRKKRRVKRAQ
ncbi:MAG: hypothetical protein L3J98_00130 [Gammaproteobacteria bacterium]|nr:hypothetical protein [Gammaproteobacteria bacterium]